MKKISVSFILLFFCVLDFLCFATPEVAPRRQPSDYVCEGVQVAIAIRNLGLGALRVYTPERQQEILRHIQEYATHFTQDQIQSRSLDSVRDAYAATLDTNEARFDFGFGAGLLENVLLRLLERPQDSIRESYVYRDLTDGFVTAQEIRDVATQLGLNRHQMMGLIGYFHTKVMTGQNLDNWFNVPAWRAINEYQMEEFRNHDNHQAARNYRTEYQQGITQRSVAEMAQRLNIQIWEVHADLQTLGINLAQAFATIPTQVELIQIRQAVQNLLSQSRRSPYLANRIMHAQGGQPFDRLKIAQILCTGRNPLLTTEETARILGFGHMALDNILRYQTFQGDPRARDAREVSWGRMLREEQGGPLVAEEQILVRLWQLYSGQEQRFAIIAEELNQMASGTFQLNVNATQNPHEFRTPESVRLKLIAMRLWPAQDSTAPAPLIPPLPATPPPVRIGNQVVSINGRLQPAALDFILGVSIPIPHASAEQAEAALARRLGVLPQTLRDFLREHNLEAIATVASRTRWQGRVARMEASELTDAELRIRLIDGILEHARQNNGVVPSVPDIVARPFNGVLTTQSLRFTGRAGEERSQFWLDVVAAAEAQNIYIDILSIRLNPTPESWRESQRRIAVERLVNYIREQQEADPPVLFPEIHGRGFPTERTKMTSTFFFDELFGNARQAWLALRNRMHVLGRSFRLVDYMTVVQDTELQNIVKQEILEGYLQVLERNRLSTNPPAASFVWLSRNNQDENENSTIIGRRYNATINLFNSGTADRTHTNFRSAFLRFCEERGIVEPLLAELRRTMN